MISPGRSSLPQGLRRHSAVLFDLDGTLVDSCDAVLATYREVFKDVLSHELSEVPQDTRRRWLAMRPAEVFAETAPHHVDACARRYAELYQRHSEALCVPMVGVRDLLTWLEEQRILVGVVTTKGRERALWEIERLALMTKGAVVVGAGDTVERKPHPAPLHLALARANVAAEQTIYVGDGPHDVVAAKAAGMTAVAVAYGYYPKEEIERANPDFIVDDVAQLRSLLAQILDLGR